MKKLIVLLALCTLPMMAAPEEKKDKNPSQMVMVAYEAVLKGAHTMLTDARAAKYKDALAKGIAPLAIHLEELNDLADDIENAQEWNAALQESQIKLTSLISQVKVASLPFTQMTPEHEALADALEDFADEMEDMQDELQPKEID